MSSLSQPVIKPISDLTSIPLSHHHVRAFKPEQLSPPRDFTQPDFAHDKRLIVEIGAGKGKHALQYAAANPNDQLIAIERTKAKFDAFAKQASTTNLHNLLPIHADAIPWIIHALAPASIDGVYLLYPNPEPHNPNQQWLNMPFFEFLLSRLKGGSEIILASNIEPYIDQAQHRALATWCLTTVREQVPNDSARTHFEIKYLARGERCWQLTMTKPEVYHTRFDSWLAV